MAIILIAEDDADTLHLLSRIVEEMGHQVMRAACGTEALELCTPAVDLALLDYMLPGADGAEIALELKLLGVPYMFLSATNDDVVVGKLLGLAPVAYMVKPFGVREVRISIEAALSQASRDPRNTLTRVINQAVGMLMERHRLNNREAFVMLRNAARRHKLPVLSLAEQMTGCHDIIYQVKSA